VFSEDTRDRRTNAVVSVRDVVALALRAAKCMRVPVVAVEFGFAGIASSAECNVAKVADAVLQGEREGLGT
jgi:predicted dienelactone hydrolase